VSSIVDRGLAFLQSAIEDSSIGTSVDVLKYQASASPNIYRQRTRQFAAAVSVPCLVSLNESTDNRTIVGNNEMLEAEIVLVRPHLEESFPGVTMEEMITLADELGFRNRRWRVTYSQATGQYGDDPDVLHVKARPRVGKEFEAYP